eukprot:gene13839-15285_t
MENQDVKHTYICEFCCAPFTKKEDFLLHFTESACKKQNICRIESYNASQETEAGDKDVEMCVNVEEMPETSSNIEAITAANQEQQGGEGAASQPQPSSFSEVVVTNAEPQILCTVDMILCEQGNKIFITPDAIRVAQQQDNLQQILSICEMASSQQCVAEGVKIDNAGGEQGDIIEAQDGSGGGVVVSVSDLVATGINVPDDAQTTEQLVDAEKVAQAYETIQTQAIEIAMEQSETDGGITREDISTVMEQVVEHQEMNSEGTGSTEEAMFKCDVCQRVFKKSAGLERHKIVHTRDITKSFTCDACGRIFTTLNRLLKHEEVHEKTREEEHRKKHEEQAAQNEDKLEENKETFICETCNKTFSQSCCLLEHERVHFKENLKKGKDKFQCDLCEKTFQAASHLARHKKSHSKKKELYYCDTCDESFAKYSLLLKHQMRHTNIKPYICNICDRGFMQSSNLTTHQRTHSKTKPYQCRSCNKAFSHSSSRVIHERTHTGEKPYSCESCGKKFRQSGDLAKHQRSHTGEKPYQCAVCDKAFSVQSNLLAHLRIHVKKNSETSVPIAMVITEESSVNETMQQQQASS